MLREAGVPTCLLSPTSRAGASSTDSASQDQWQGGRGRSREMSQKAAGSEVPVRAC